ncbi:5-oxoprolinase subunit PxpA [Ekhidna sp. To15]|uniref:5-oxoprolinase subunit PxpA n=1 Tax=Ekhidna sp. To15 TaxID=3395267 RepID=UPI003F5255C8
MSVAIDLNADLGEHPDSDLDEQIMPYISSCNIACGGHIGDESSVRKTITLAKQNGAAVGAHPSYPDRENFGRKIIQMQPQQLADSIAEQIELVQRICHEENVDLHHIKPHGALYNHAAAVSFISELILNVIKEVAPNVYWMGLANSASESVAQIHMHPFIAEGFADRQYESDGSLRSRTKQGAVLNPQEVLKQVEELAMNGRVNAGGWLKLSVQSICLHGDTEGAVTLAKEINEHLVSKGIQIAAI